MGIFLSRYQAINYRAGSSLWDLRRAGSPARRGGSTLPEHINALCLLLSRFLVSAPELHLLSLPVPVHYPASVPWPGSSVLCFPLVLRLCVPLCACPQGGCQIPTPAPVGPWDSGCVASAYRRRRPIPTVFSLAPAWAPARVVRAFVGQQGAKGPGLSVGSVSIKGAGAAAAASPGFLNAAS